MADTDTPSKEPAAEAHSFQAEVAELLRLMVHSVYSETDIFLRKLLAIEELRLVSEPDVSYKKLIEGYEVRNFIVAID